LERIRVRKVGLILSAQLKSSSRLSTIRSRAKGGEDTLTEFGSKRGGNDRTGCGTNQKLTGRRIGRNGSEGHFRERRKFC